MVHAYEFDSTNAYFFLTLAPGGQGIGPFNGLIESVRRMSASEAAAVKPRRIDIVTVKSGDTVQSLANRMAYDDYKLERFQVLNNLNTNSALKSGQRVKIILLDK
jgi:predicted Zn-dependent protease